MIRLAPRAAEVNAISHWNLGNGFAITTVARSTLVLRKTDDILDISVATNPGLSAETRRGPGFYKVPSLRGLWLRGLYGHEGAAASLEAWFDPSRLRPNYEPKGYYCGPGPIEGHEFGLRLNSDEKSALIAFLRTP
jgi:hypothetical protein